MEPGSKTPDIGSNVREKNVREHDLSRAVSPLRLRLRLRFRLRVKG